jgi:drug/metabolite transporter (DMT)-like permease
MLWIFLTVAAAPLQVARNVFQRGLVGEAGPWGATLVRFLFGLPFSAAMLAIAWAVWPEARLDFSGRFWLAELTGTVSQVLATACLLVSMRRSGFAVATLFQQASMPLSAVLGWLWLGDAMSPLAYLGLGLATAGLTVISWPKQGVAGSWSGAAYGLASASFFAVALNGYREAGLALDAAHPIVAAIAALTIAQVLQSVVMVALLAVLKPHALRVIALSWRASLGAGFFGSAASACWFSALALSPAGAVRAVSVIEAPIAAAAGRKLFNEKLSLRQIAAGLVTTGGVLLAALG